MLAQHCKGQRVAEIYPCATPGDHLEVVRLEDLRRAPTIIRCTMVAAKQAAFDWIHGGQQRGNTMLNELIGNVTTKSDPIITRIVHENAEFWIGGGKAASIRLVKVQGGPLVISRFDGLMQTANVYATTREAAEKAAKDWIIGGTNEQEGDLHP